MNKIKYEDIWEFVTGNSQHKTDAAELFYNHLNNLSLKILNKSFKSVKINKKKDNDIVFIEGILKIPSKSSELFDFFIHGIYIETPEKYFKAFKMHRESFGIIILDAINSYYEFAPHLLSPQLPLARSKKILTDILSKNAEQFEKKNYEQTIKKKSSINNNFINSIKRFISFKKMLLAVPAFAIIISGLTLFLKMVSFESQKQSESNYTRSIELNPEKNKAIESKKNVLIAKKNQNNKDRFLVASNKGENLNVKKLDKISETDGFRASFSARCIQGNCETGKGTMEFADGYKYEGQWKDGKMDGQGIYSFVNTPVYIGQFKNGKKEGKGTMIYPRGDKYEGQWKDGLEEGQGTLFDSSGKIIYNGLWKHGFVDK